MADANNNGIPFGLILFGLAGIFTVEMIKAIWNRSRQPAQAKNEKQK